MTKEIINSCFIKILKINNFLKNDIETIDPLFLQDILDSDKLLLTKKAIINATKKKISETKEPVATPAGKILLILLLFYC
jgi:hypothetical protein